MDYLTTHTSLSPIRRGFAPGFVNYKKGCTRLAAAKLLAHGRWFSAGTLTSSTTKTGRHDIAEILLKVALNTIIQIKSYQIVHVLIFSHFMSENNLIIMSIQLRIRVFHVKTKSILELEHWVIKLFQF